MSEGNPETLPGHAWLPEPDLTFHPSRFDDAHYHPLKGLLEFGPYSRSLVTPVLDPIRIAAIYPSGWQPSFQSLVAELNSPQRPRERRQYLISYPGFDRVFSVRLVPADLEAQIELEADLDERVLQSKTPHLVLANRISQAIKLLENRRTEFDVLLILLSQKWQDGFKGDDGSFDLHDFLKAEAAIRSIPCQLANDEPNGALRYHCRASVAWRLGIATYVKAGGVPWKLATQAPDTAFIGLSYALRAPASMTSQRFVTCCSQVFDADGAGLEFIAYDTGSVRFERDNPFLTRGEMRRVMARSLELFQRRHGGRLPRRVAVHKSTEFKGDEVDGCLDAFAAVDDVRLVHVQQDVSWRGVKIDRPKQPGNYPPDRGSFQALGSHAGLLWTQGDAQASLGRHYYKEGKSIPSPLLLNRYGGHGSLVEDAGDVLALTKMNWNNDNLYDRLPATLAYASVLARTIKRIPDLVSRPYHLRFFM